MLSRHLAPRGHLLRADERRHVVEDEDNAFRQTDVADQGRRGHREMNLLTVARDRDLLSRRFGAAAAQALEQRRDRLQVGPIESGLRGLADNRSIQTEQPGRRAVDGRDRARRVHRDDARRDALENRLDVAPPPFALLVFAFQLDRGAVDLAAAGGKLARHRVESLDERAELVGSTR